MKSDELLNAMGDIEDRFIEEAALHEPAQQDSAASGGESEPSRKVETIGTFSGKNWKRRRRARLIWFGSAAAAVCAAFLSVMSLRIILKKDTAQEAGAVKTEEAAAEDGDAALMLPEEAAGLAAMEAQVDEAGAEEADNQTADFAGEADEEAVLFTAGDDRDFITCTTLEDAERLAGFDLGAPEEYEGHTLTTIRCVTGEMLELIYRDAGGHESIRIRKASGEDMLDDYEGDYEVDETSGAGDLQVRLRGTFEGIDVVTWEKDGYFFSIDTDGTALSREQAAALVSRIQ